MSSMYERNRTVSYYEREWYRELNDILLEREARRIATESNKRRAYLVQSAQQQEEK